MNIISFDIKVNNKVVATFSVNTDETTVRIADKSTCKTSTEQSDIDTSMIDWRDVQKFVKENSVDLNETESGVLESYIKRGTLTESQKRVLPYVLKRVKEHGFKPSYPF